MDAKIPTYPKPLDIGYYIVMVRGYKGGECEGTRALL